MHKYQKRENKKEKRKMHYLVSIYALYEILNNHNRLAGKPIQLIESK